MRKTLATLTLILISAFVAIHGSSYGQKTNVDTEAKIVEKILKEARPAQEKVNALKRFKDLVNSEYTRLKDSPNNHENSEFFNRLGYLSVGLNLIDFEDFELSQCASTRRTLLFHFDPTRDEGHRVSSEIRWIENRLIDICGSRSDMTKEDL